MAMSAAVSDTVLFPASRFRAAHSKAFAVVALVLDGLSRNHDVIPRSASLRFAVTPFHIIALIIDNVIHFQPGYASALGFASPLRGFATLTSATLRALRSCAPASGTCTKTPGILSSRNHYKCHIVTLKSLGRTPGSSPFGTVDANPIYQKLLGRFANLSINIVLAQP